jgi:hypothetical protein
VQLSEIGDLVNAGGVVVLLVGALFGGYKGWWVWGAQARAVEKDRDEWKALAMRSLTAADKATTVAMAHTATPVPFAPAPPEGP